MYLMLLHLILVILNNQSNANDEINEIDIAIEKNVIELLNKAKKCVDPESCANQFLNGLASFSDQARFKGIIAFCNESRKEMKIKDVLREIMMDENKINNEESTKYLKLYIDCINDLFKKNEINEGESNENFKGLFYLDKLDESPKHLEISENYSKLLRSFMLTRPLYLAEIMHESFLKLDTNTLLEIICTQKLEDLELAIKIIKLLNPNFEINFKEFSLKQNIFDSENLEKFINWRFDPKCNEEPVKVK
uniref:Uncharacterized protein n=1 Tax=Meloidogyne hapla TaxID=6305 RepID=A0A1I8BJH0_MELHA